MKVINHLSFFLFEWNGAVDKSKKISKVLVIKKPLVSKKRKECDNYEALPEVELRTGLGAFVACRSESRYLKV